MAIKTLTPYVGFRGTADQAVRLYEKALGAKVLHMMRWSEGPMAGQMPAEARDKIMHCALSLGGGQIMVCDEPPGGSSSGDSNISICLECDDNDDMSRKFAALAEGGQVVMAIHDAFWGATFGMLRDAFGVKWMFVGPKRS
ncbi:MAG TPA: VOC family protein [Planctomycetota bacterium]|nr:VOC family protein [Planctomycetota bacterium]